MIDNIVTLSAAELQAALKISFRLAESMLRKPSEPVFTNEEIEKEISGVMAQFQQRTEDAQKYLDLTIGRF